MTIQEIYETFNAIGCLTFATINEAGEPETRIAHLRGWDDDGIYFMTMFTKEFYAQLKTTGKVSICGLNANANVAHDAKGMPVFEEGYAVRMTGDVVEVTIPELQAKENPMFAMCIKDWQKYGAMVVFCITAGNGDIFDYDFEKINRDHKLARTYFCYNGRAIKEKALHIDPEICIGCGNCEAACSFSAIGKNGKVYTIDSHRCDECGDCYLRCPVDAISYGGTHE